MTGVMQPLLPPCPVCRTGVTDDPRKPCAGCQAAFGDQIRLSETDHRTAEEFTADLEESEARVAAVLAARRFFTPLDADR